MKIEIVHLYIIDYFNLYKQNGLTAYVSELTGNLKNHPQIKLNYVWIKSDAKYQQFEKTCLDGNMHYYIPDHVGIVNEPGGYDQQVAAYLAQEISDENVVFHINWINHCPFIWFLKQKISCKAVLTKHCIPWRDSITTNYPLFYYLSQTLFRGEQFLIPNPELRREMMGYEAIDHIITVTDFARDSLLTLFGIPAGKVSTVYNGLSLPPTSLDTSVKFKLREQYGFRQGEILLLFAGSIIRRKGIYELVEAFCQLVQETNADIRLVIAGPGEYAEVLKSCKKYWSKITFTGDVDKETLYDFYKMCDIGIMPSYIEQCSYTVIEMLYHELPIIVSDVDGLKEIIQSNFGLRVKATYTASSFILDRQDLIYNIKKCIANPEEAQNRAKTGKAFAMKYLSVDAMIKKTTAVYLKMLIENAIKPEISKLKLQLLGRISDPFISIVIPCYNAGRYLQACLDSIYNQTYSDFEIILIDDGSTDNTNAILARNDDPRIVYITNKKNRGISYSLNRGIKVARGKYIARMDGDDCMSPQRLEEQLIFLENNPDYGLVGSWHTVIDCNGFPINRIESFCEHEELKLALLFQNPFAHSATMMRSSILKEMLYSSRYRHCEDYELWCRMSRRAKVKNLSSYLLQYRIHHSGTSNLNQKEQRKNVIMLLARELDKLNIQYTAEELMLHSSIGFGLSSSILSNNEQRPQLQGWIERFFSSKGLRKRFKEEHINKFRKLIMNGLFNFSSAQQDNLELNKEEVLETVDR